MSEGQPEGSEGLSEGSEGLTKGLEGLPGGWGGHMHGHTDVHTNRISPHSTGLCPLLGPLILCNLKEAGQGNR